MQTFIFFPIVILELFFTNFLLKNHLLKILSQCSTFENTLMEHQAEVIAVYKYHFKPFGLVFDVKTPPKNFLKKIWKILEFTWLAENTGCYWSLVSIRPASKRCHHNITGYPCFRGINMESVSGSWEENWNDENQPH